MTSELVQHFQDQRKLSFEVYNDQQILKNKPEITWDEYQELVERKLEIEDDLKENTDEDRQESSDSVMCHTHRLH